VSGGVDIVFLDVGGPIYDSRVWARAALGALRELGAEVTEEDFWLEYDRRRRAQSSFTRGLAERFLGPDADPAAVAARVEPRWRYTPEALHDDVLPTLERLAGRYRIGVLANQPAATHAALERDGIAPYVDVWVVSGDVGFSKPDPRIFAHAVAAAGCAPERVAFVGDRLDNDVRPAKAAGLRAIWLLRGEASPEPTAEQLAEPDAAIGSLAELPEALERLAAVAA
jgi:HAD superfamily hydrolase (TIGR01509 family)